MITFWRMNSHLYLTPASVAYLTQFILALAITVFLIRRLRSHSAPSLTWLTVFFAPMTVFSGLLVFNAALLPYPRLLTVFAENAFLGLALVGLNGFAYHFPQRYPQHKREMRMALGLSLAYFLFEVGFMIFRYISLLDQGKLFIRPALVASSIPIIFLFALVASLRQTLAADPRPLAWWRKLWKPEGKDAQGARNFALVFAIPVVLGIINALIFLGLPLSVIHAAVSIGVLLMFWSFANNYVNFIPGSVDVASRLSILVLTLFLALFGTIGWLIAPSYVSTFQPNLREHQTLRFTPDPSGGYNVSEVDFHFESALGEKYNQRVEFTFPFYGKTYTEIYIVESGVIGLGQPPRYNNQQDITARVPTIFPLMLSLASDPADQDSGLYVRQEAGRLIVTWNRLQASSQPEEPYTFQTILYADGTFEFTYYDLPQHILFHPNSVPSDDPWMRGAVAGRGEPLQEPSASGAVDLIMLSQNGDSPLLENFHTAFRRYLHNFMLPVAWVVVGGSLLILLAIPLLLRSSVARPLEALTDGVRRMGSGELNITIPIQSEDEIGFLTGAFNMMNGEIEDLVRNLETRVADRTRELDDANASLRAEMRQREAVQKQLIQQQSAVAAFEERERLARELHDGIGQTLGFINLQADAARALIQQGNKDSTFKILARLAEVAQEAHGDLRGYIKNLKNEAPTGREDFFFALERYCERLRQAYLFTVILVFPRNPPDPLASAKVETHLTYIIREALSNARRYSGQEQASVSIEADDQTVQVVIEDKGVGMATQYTGPERRAHERFGLRIMRERVSEIGGALTIESEAGEGTRVTVRAPRDLLADSFSHMRIVIVDDHPLFMDGLRNMLATRGAQVVGAAKDGIDAQAVVRSLKPDLILMDINMPNMNGLEATRRIKADMPEAKIVMLTTSASEADLFEALRAGAAGYLLKGMSAERFFAVLGDIERGEAEFSAEMAQKILEEFHSSQGERAQSGEPGQAFDTEILTERQAEILRLVANGLMYKEIAERVFLTERTVKYHMGEILARLHLKSRRAAEEYAKRRGIQ